MVYLIVAIDVAYIAVAKCVIVIIGTHFARLAKVTLGVFVTHLHFAILATHKLFIHAPLKQLVYFSIFKFFTATVAFANIIDCVANVETAWGVKQS
jgi:cobalamin biosynthesis protein CbiD